MGLFDSFAQLFGGGGGCRHCGGSGRINAGRTPRGPQYRDCPYCDAASRPAEDHGPTEDPHRHEYEDRGTYE